MKTAEIIKKIKSQNMQQAFASFKKAKAEGRIKKISLTSKQKQMLTNK